MQLTSTKNEVDKVKFDLTMVDTKLAQQIVEGFKDAIVQVKIVVEDVDFDVVDPSKEVVNYEIVEVVEWGA